MHSPEISESEHPLAAFAGMLKDHPLFEEWQKAMADYRRQADEERGFQGVPGPVAEDGTV